MTASRILIRLAKSRAAWEQDAETIAKSEFRKNDGSVDLLPSVYEIDSTSQVPNPRQLVQVCVEHVTSLLSPNNHGAPCIGIPLDSLTVTKSLGATSFSFSNSAHREVVMSDRAALLEFISQLKTALSNADESINLPTIYRYVEQMSATKEWKTAAVSNPKVQKWCAQVAKRPPYKP